MRVDSRSARFSRSKPIPPRGGTRWLR